MVTQAAGDLEPQHFMEEAFLPEWFFLHLKLQKKLASSYHANDVAPKTTNPIFKFIFQK